MASPVEQLRERQADAERGADKSPRVPEHASFFAPTGVFKPVLRETVRHGEDE
jgi:hypothetical protein